MEKQIFELLTKMNREFQEMKTDIHNLRSEMHGRFDNVDSKIEGIGLQFELTNESRINDVVFITDKVNKLEKEVFIIKTNKN
ncbi:hypothetical protein H1D32_08880 [Anaerobacillus sp. CMMVII]|uniref:hypothetical protein n=1 Tax=Anaerobacillus sp. CMMVII TaxID=2755588 RepID=UPI0021B845FC|nr:hypothetical protein [Anaerobacillus sp. CMMVII]MCT8137857.1 hypothetical protein [Anaerobacillus sp. CMMVII]